MLVLALSVWLTPAEAGVGTHTQLGLEPCIMLSALGMPCPMCGMTTTFTLMAHLRPIDAFTNQPFGVVLFLSTVMIAFVSAVEIISPKNRWATMITWMIAREWTFIAGLSLGFFGSWLYKIALITHFLS